MSDLEDPLEDAATCHAALKIVDLGARFVNVKGSVENKLKKLKINLKNLS